MTLISKLKLAAHKFFVYDYTTCAPELIGFGFFDFYLLVFKYIFVIFFMSIAH